MRIENVFLIAFLAIAAAPFSAEALPRAIFIQPQGIFTIEHPIEMIVSKQNYRFGDDIVFARFTLLPQMKSMAQFQIMLHGALPANSTQTVENVAQEYAADIRRRGGVAIGPISITPLTIAGKDARRVQYLSPGVDGKKVILEYHYLIVERYMMTILTAAYPDELPKYQPIFDKMLKGLKINSQALSKVFPLTS